MLQDWALHGGVTRIHGPGVLRSMWAPPAFSHGALCHLVRIFGVSELFWKLCEWRLHQRRLWDLSPFLLCSVIPLSSQNTWGGFRIHSTWNRGWVFNHLCLWGSERSQFISGLKFLWSKPWWWDFSQYSLLTKMESPTKNVSDISKGFWYLMCYGTHPWGSSHPAYFSKVVLLAVGMIPFPL